MTRPSYMRGRPVRDLPLDLTPPWRDPPEWADDDSAFDRALDHIYDEALADHDDGYALDDPRHPAAPLDVDEPAIESQWDTEP